MDMSKEQLQIFWHQFRTLDDEKRHYHRPPTGWKPKDCRDMTPQELTLYWAGFQKVMQIKMANIPDGVSSDSSDSGSDSSGEQVSSDCAAPAVNQHAAVVEKKTGVPMSAALVVSNSSVPNASDPSTAVVPTCRIRKKTTEHNVLTLNKIASLREAKSSMKQALTICKTQDDDDKSDDDEPPVKRQRRTPGGYSPGRKKRVYQNKLSTTRKGKRPCVSIWTKVQLFKVAWCYTVSFLYLMIGVDLFTQYGFYLKTCYDLCS